MDTSLIWLMIAAGILVSTLVTSGRSTSRTTRRARRDRVAKTRGELPLA